MHKKTSLQKKMPQPETWDSKHMKNLKNRLGTESDAKFSLINYKNKKESLIIVLNLEKKGRALNNLLLIDRSGKCTILIGHPEQFCAL